MDARIDYWTHRIYSFCIQWALIGWNNLTVLWDSFCEWCIRILQALEHAHKQDIWLFTDANITPTRVRGIDALLESDVAALVYNTETNTFLLHNVEQNSRVNRFDCVDVTFQFPNELQMNLTEFFMNVQWKSGSAPSLLECIILFGMIQNMHWSVSKVSTGRIEVIDSNADTHIIELQSRVAYRRFKGWTL